MKRFLLLPFLFLLLNAQAQDGTLDLSFGNKGIINVKQQFSSTAFTKDGKFMGTIVQGKKILSAYRFNSDGLPDATFGTNGVLQITPEFEQISGDDHSIVIQNDGKILIGSTIYATEHFEHDQLYTIKLLRYDTQGKPDQEFNNKCSNLYTSKTYANNIHSISAGPTGLIILIMSYANAGSGMQTRFATLDANGTELGTGGINFKYQAHNFLKKVGFGGKDLVVLTGEQAISTKVTQVLLLYKDGKKAPHFGLDGQVEVSAFKPDVLAVQDDGKVLVTDGTKLFRLLQNGRTDLSFGNNGMANAGFIIGKILPRETGKIIVGGMKDNKFAVAQYNGDGKLDPSFGNAGVTITDVGVAAGISNMSLWGSRLYVYGRSFIAAYHIGNGKPLPSPVQ